VHGEVTRSEVDIFDREAVFSDEVLSQTVNDFPKWKIVFEQITTKNAVDFVREIFKHYLKVFIQLSFNKKMSKKCLKNV
jgi:dihydroorotase